MISVGPPPSVSVAQPNSALVEDPTDPAAPIASPHPAELIRDLVDDGQLVCALAWLELAKKPLDIQALAIAVAITTNPGCRTTQQLKECRPKFDEGSADNAGSTSFELVGRELYFQKRSVKDILAHDPLATNFELSQSEWTDLSLAKACVAFLSLDDFREYPLRTENKGRDPELWKLHPFLRYAAPYWYEHVQSVEDAALLEPELDKIIDPAQNYLYFWTDQRSGSWGNGPRKFFRSRCEVAIKFDFPWLALYLLDTTSSEVEDMFPARDLKFIARSAPRVLQLLLRKKEQYYLPVITKKLLTNVGGHSQSFMVLQTLLYERHMLQLPSKLLIAMAEHEERDQIFDSLFSSMNNVPVTHYTVLYATRSLNLLQTFFQKVPGLQVDSAMLGAAVSTWETLRFLLDHGGGIHVTEDILLMAVKQYCDVDRLQLLLEACPHTSTPSKVIKAAIKLDRLEMVKYIFEYDKDLKVSKELLETAVSHGGHELDIPKYVLDRCDVSLITEDILLAAMRRPNSAFKTVKLVWHYKNDLEITDKLLVASTRNFDGLTDWLLSIQERHEVPHEVVDEAVEREKRRAAWDFPDSGLLKTLQQRVPNDPYLRKILAETCSSPPVPKSSEGGRSKQTAHYAAAVPNAASRSDLNNLIALLNKGADIDGRTGSTCSCDRNKGVGTALQRAMKLRDIEMVKLLLDRGANPDIQEGDFGNPLQEASIAGDLELVQLLVEHKAMINHRGGRYRNPLTAAARANDVKIVQFLIEHGADTNIVDDNGWTPYLWAVASESHHVVGFLQGRDPSIGAIGELIALWPSRLEDHASVKMGDDRLIIITDTTDVKQMCKCISLYTDRPMLPTMSFYFEMTVVRLGSERAPLPKECSKWQGYHKKMASGSAIAIGFAEKKPHNIGMPGWFDDSWAYHGDDGHIYEEGDRHIIAPYPTYGAGDVVGCGVDFASKTAYFTKNGQRLGTAYCMISGQLFPVVGVGERDIELRVNFGEEPFVYQC